MQQSVILTKSPSDTRNLGKRVGRQIKGGDVITLSGELGSGKTTFAGGFVTYFTGKKRVLSPTFNIVRHYANPDQKAQVRHIYHLDLYRIIDPREVLRLGVWDVIGQTDTVVLIEWPEIITKLIPEKRIDIKFENVVENERQIIINNPTVWSK